MFLNSTRSCLYVTFVFLQGNFLVVLAHPRYKNSEMVRLVEDGAIFEDYFLKEQSK